MTDHYDVIVIGSGAGGGTLTHALAPTGKRILLLERGDFLPREPQNWDSKSVWVDLRYHNSGTWTDEATGEEFAPGLHPFPLPVGLIYDESAPQFSPCIRCATCDGFPCLVNGKADATSCVWRRRWPIPTSACAPGPGSRGWRPARAAAL